MDDLFEFYKAYGESLATRLAAIGHTPLRPAFVFVEDLDNPVEVMTFTGNGKAPAGKPVLVWDNFDEDLETGGRDNYHFAIKGSFAVIVKALTTNEKSAAYRQCRAIALKAFTLMLADSEHGILEQEGIQLEVRQIPLQKVGPLSVTWYGYGIEFSWQVPTELSLSDEEVLP